MLPMLIPALALRPTGRLFHFILEVSLNANNADLLCTGSRVLMNEIAACLDHFDKWPGYAGLAGNRNDKPTMATIGRNFVLAFFYRDVEYTK
jgi:hypothetical protein